MCWITIPEGFPPRCEKTLSIQKTYRPPRKPKPDTSETLRSRKKLRSRSLSRVLSGRIVRSQKQISKRRFPGVDAKLTEDFPRTFSPRLFIQARWDSL